MILPNATIILFDGVCNLCNSSIQFILKHEKKPIFMFGILQSEKVQQLLNSFSNHEITDSVLLFENGILYQESTAALRIARYLKFYWILYPLIFLPKGFRDVIYKWVARNRYKWFGKRESCMIPSKELINRFL